MTANDLLKTLFPKRWIPDRKPGSTIAEPEIEFTNELLLPTHAYEVGTYEIGTMPEGSYAFKDQRHFQIIETHFKEGKVIMVVYSFAALQKVSPK